MHTHKHKIASLIYVNIQYIPTLIYTYIYVHRYLPTYVHNFTTTLQYDTIAHMTKGRRKT